MNKRKSRPGPARPQRQRSVVADGIYSNSLFMHAATSRVGNVVQVTTRSQAVFEGIFRTFSPQFQVVLEMAHRKDNNGDDKINVDSVVERLIFKPSDIVSIVAKDVDLDYATRDTFQTDTAISSRCNGNSRIEDKELEPWDSSGVVNGDVEYNLELDNANGWDVNDMFHKNETVYGVQSTFDQSLTGYTVQIQKTDSQDYKEQEKEAEKIANEIENNPTYKERAELENGDEETTFAAVQRPPNASSSPQPMAVAPVAVTMNDKGTTTANPATVVPSTAKYVPPAKRKNLQTGKLTTRSTPPPPHNGGPMPQQPQSPHAPHKNSYQSMSMQQQQQQQQQVQVQPQQPPNMLPPQQPPQPTHLQPHQHASYMQHNVGQPQYAHIQHQQPPPQQQLQQQQPQQSHHQQQVVVNNNSNNGNLNKMNGDGNVNTNSKPMPQRTMRQYGQSNANVNVNAYSEPPPSINPQQMQSMGKPPMHVPHPHQHVVATHIPPPDTQPTHVVSHHVVLAPPPQMVGQQMQQPPSQPQRRTRDMEIDNLRSWHQDYKLAPPPQQQQQQVVPQPVPTVSPHPQQHVQAVQATPQQPPPQQIQQQQQEITVVRQNQQTPSPPIVKQNQIDPQQPQTTTQQHQSSQTTASGMVGMHHQQQQSSQIQSQNQRPQTTTTPPQQQTSVHNPNNSSNNNNINNTNNSNNNNNSSNSSSSETTPTSNSGGNVNSGAGQTTSIINNNNGENKTNSIAKKTFQLNPAAKPFTPRSPSTPNPSRPHTPQTPGPAALTQNNYAGPQQPQQQQQHVAASQPQMMMTYVMQPPQAAYPTPTGPQNRMRKMQVAASQIQVAAATGQPLLTPAPMQQFLQYPQAPHPQHFQSQAFAPFVRFASFEPPQYLTPTPPSTTPSPGQPHQQFHPGPQPTAATAGPPTAYAQQQTPQFQMMCPLITPPQIAPPFYAQPTAGQPHHPQHIQVIMSQQHPSAQ
uniref:Putative ataxin-2 n=1 Tax=Corethrella appendiculata TaxID=1370023 RepID=U5ENL3_9DIPT